MADDRLMRVLRAQAWERAKGELCSMHHTFWGETDKFNHFDALVKQFVEKIEAEELQT